MTLPTNVTLPLSTAEIMSGKPEDLYNYMRRFVYNISQQIQQTNQALNGSTTLINSDSLPAYSFILGSTTSGTATYTNPVIWVRRLNLMVFAWFDISWVGHTGTGNLLVQLPYYSLNSIASPFVGVIEPDNMTFGAGYTYLTGNLLPNTNTIEIHQCGSGKAEVVLPISAIGHLRGSITYAGQQNI